ncbi:3-phosphoshikimate 1-carboxyvinyltransferase 2 [Capsicum annuum]|nr:3-phosphoshikimate 1-carboxyvinyltransferase 2 [Capsicum annuum]
MKRLRAIDVNMNKMPNVAMTLTVVALFANSPTTIRDGMATLFPGNSNLIELGATVVEGSDYCIITPPEKLNLTEIDTYDDHKIAMVFSLVACAYEPLRTPVVLAKPFPTTLTLSSSRK